MLIKNLLLLLCFWFTSTVNSFGHVGTGHVGMFCQPNHINPGQA